MQKPIRRDARQTSCNECHRRKQRCNSRRDDGPCDHCARRFPPVLCIGRPPHATRCNIQQPNKRIETDLDTGFRELHPVSLDTSSQVFALQTEENLVPRIGNSLYGNPTSFGGILTEINCADIPSVDPSPRNTELFQFYCQALAPTMASFDGQDAPSVIQNKILPWMMQSPLMPQIAIFSASGYRALNRGQEVTKYPETVALKGMVLSSINSYLNQDFGKIHEEAIQSVIHLALLEWYIGEPTNMWAHMRGLKGMLRLREGIRELQNSKLRQLLVLSDYMLSCSFERDLFIVQPEDSFIIPSSISHPELYSSPLFDSDLRFSEIHEKLGLNTVVASILDDVRLITTLSFSTFEGNHMDLTLNESSTVIQSIACKIYDNLQLLPIKASNYVATTTEIIYETIHLTAEVYTSAIASRIPFSLAYTPELRRKLYENLRKVDMSSWKKIPGIFLWVLFVACPGSGDDVQSRLLRRNASLTSVYLGFRALGLSVWCLRNLYRVQRWIASGIQET